MSRFEVDRPDQRKVVSTRVEEVILTVSELGATFPDVAQFLTEANSQRNLAGRLEIDALPRAGRFYERNLGATEQNRRERKKRVGSSNMQAQPVLNRNRQACLQERSGRGRGNETIALGDDKAETGHKEVSSRPRTTTESPLKTPKASTSDATQRQ